MNAHVPQPANVVRLPTRLRLVPAAPSALDALLSGGTIDGRQHAAGIAYAAARRRFDASGGRHGIPHEAWPAVKREHAALIRAAGAERFVLDRLCLNDVAPLRCEMDRVRDALGRVALHLSA